MQIVLASFQQPLHLAAGAVSYTHLDVYKRQDNCLTAIVGDKLPIETARKTFFFLLGIAVMLIVIALPSPSPFYKGEEAIPLTANAKILSLIHISCSP